MKECRKNYPAQWQTYCVRDRIYAISQKLHQKLCRDSMYDDLGGTQKMVGIPKIG